MKPSFNIIGCSEHQAMRARKWIRYQEKLATLTFNTEPNHLLRIGLIVEVDRGNGPVEKRIISLAMLENGLVEVECAPFAK